MTPTTNEILAAISRAEVYYVHDRDEPQPYSVLVFPAAWVGTLLPVSPKDRADYDTIPRSFLVELLDTEDGKVYHAHYWPQYEWTSNNPDTTIHVYSFREHYCPCHRKIDALAGGADTDEECEGNRFRVQSITVPDHFPGLVLYSETMAKEELDARLARSATP